MFYKAPNQYITEGQAFTVEGIQYPANWLNLASAEEKAALGLVEVTTVGARGDERFYWVSETLDGATLTYTNTPKEIGAVKESAVSQVNQTVYAILFPSDFVEARNLRDPLYKPDWMTWRDSVRAEAATAKEAINACITVDEVAAVMANIDWPVMAGANI